MRPTSRTWTATTMPMTPCSTVSRPVHRDTATTTADLTAYVYSHAPYRFTLSLSCLSVSATLASAVQTVGHIVCGAEPARHSVALSIDGNCRRLFMLDLVYSTWRSPSHTRTRILLTVVVNSRNLHLGINLGEFSNDTGRRATFLQQVSLLLRVKLHTTDPSCIENYGDHTGYRFCRWQLD